MGIKQTWVTKIVFTVLAVVGILSSSVIISPNAYANYTPTSGKCQNGSDPTEGVVRGRATLCAESTRTNTSPSPSPAPSNTSGGTNQSGSEQTPPADDSATSEGVTCAVEKVGWMICPIMESAAKISDNMFDVLADNFLRVEPELFNDDSGTKTAWEIARNLANIMFIIAFLVIIFSQVTGRGLNNYGIKKMLPRLIIAAIAVNVSYYICQLVVDVTNILGYEIQNAFANIADSLGPSVFGTASQYSGASTASTSDQVLTAIMAGALAAVGVVWLIIGPGMAVVSFVFMTLLTVIIILMLRKALIVLLIVASPIAFVLYLLPNTEKLFDKWRSMFGKILLVFPIVALLFGAGQLASTIILVSGAKNVTPVSQEDLKGCNPNTSGENNTGRTRGYTTECEGYITLTGNSKGEPGKEETISWTLGLVAVGVAVAPLIAVWAVLKGALAAAGAIGGRIQAGITKGGGGLSKRAEAADKARQNRTALRAMQGRPTLGGGRFRRRARRDAIRSGVEKELGRQQADFLTDETRGDDKFAAKQAGAYGLRGADAGSVARVAANAEAAHASAQKEEMNAILARANREGWSNEDFSKLAEGEAAQGLQGGLAQKAAIMKAAQEADVATLDKAIASALKHGGTDAGREMQKYIAEAINGNYSGVKAKAAYMADPGLLSSLRTGSSTDPRTGATTAVSMADVDAALDKSMSSMSEELLASQKKSTLQQLDARMTALGPSNSGVQQLKGTATRLKSADNASTYAKAGNDAKEVISKW